MAGRKQFDVDEAVKSAMIVFWTYGYPATGVERLMAATGVGKGSLYATFGSKDGLFRRALDLYATIYGAQYERALAADDPAAAIRGYLEVGLRRLEDPDVPNGCLLCQSVTDGAALKEPTRQYAQMLLNRQVARIRRFLALAGQEGHRLDELAQLVVTIQQGTVVMHAAGTTVAQLREATDTAVTAILASLDKK